MDFLTEVVSFGMVVVAASLFFVQDDDTTFGSISCEMVTTVSTTCPSVSFRESRIAHFNPIGMLFFMAMSLQYEQIRWATSSTGVACLFLSWHTIT
jgi:hypothetical protein